MKRPENWRRTCATLTPDSHSPLRLIGKLLIGYLDTTTDDSDEEDPRASYLPTGALGTSSMAAPIPRPPKGKLPPGILPSDMDDEEDESLLLR